MSRIHEALKKAASERNAQTTASSVSDLVGLVGENGEERAGTAVARDQVKNTASSAQRAPNPQFEELLRKCQHVTWKVDPRSSVFANEVKDPTGAEKFRTLRSRLYQIASTRPLKRIVVTSSLPAEGKTFIASNLALSIIRQQNRKVLLIDADLRASRLHLPFGAESAPGLSDYLRGEVDEFGIIQVGQEPNLCLIAGGTDVSNPSELLHSKAMENLLDRLAPLFDWVILDSPPAIAVHDASILADICDGVLFVVRAGATDFEVAQKAVGEFDPKHILGVVMNRVDKSQGYPYYYAYTKEVEKG